MKSASKSFTFSLIVLVSYLLCVVSSGFEWLPELRSCCITSPTETQAKDVIRCVKSQASERNKRISLEYSEAPNSEKKRIGVISQVPSDPKLLHAYSSFLKEFYAANNGYEYVFSSDRVYESSDNRWDKIKLLSAAMHTISGFAKDWEYVVWLDSDVILLNTTFKFENIIQDHPNAHIIGSALGDSKSEVNTGSLILKNSKFTRLFLDRWWGYEDEDMEDHSYYHSTMVANNIFLQGEQHQFNELLSAYKKGKLDIESTPTEKKQKNKGKIVVLPNAALNSHVPAFANQKETDMFLNLRDEAAEIRHRSFSIAYTNVCKAITSPPNKDDDDQDIDESVVSDNKSKKSKKSKKSNKSKPKLTELETAIQLLPPQLGLNISTLASIAVEEYPAVCAELREQFDAQVEGLTLSTPLAVQLDKYYQQFVEALESFWVRNMTLSSKIRLQNFQAFQSYVEGYREANQERMKTSKNKIGFKDWPSMVSRAVEAGIRVLQKGTSLQPAERRAAADICRKYIHEINDIVHENFKDSLRQLEIQVYTYLGDLETSEKDYRTAQMAYENALAACNRKSNPIECFLYPLFHLAESHAAQEQWSKAIGVYDECGSHVIKIQRNDLSATKPEYDFKYIQPDGSMEVDVLLFNVMLGRAYSFAELGDITAAQRDLNAGLKFARKANHKKFPLEPLKSKVREAIVATASKQEEKRLAESGKKEEEYDGRPLVMRPSWQIDDDDDDDDDNSGSTHGSLSGKEDDSDDADL